MVLKLINEYELRIDSISEHIVVFFRQNPDVVIGRLKINTERERDEQQERFKLMPADLVDDKIINLFDGILYTGGIISPIKCPYCNKKLYFDEYNLGENGELECCYCHTTVKVQFCNSISDAIF